MSEDLSYGADDLQDLGAVRLSCAIAMQAVKDYKTALRKRKMADVEECERFFRSAWFSQLTDLDGEKVIDAIKERVRDEKAFNRRNKQKR